MLMKKKCTQYKRRMLVEMSEVAPPVCGMFRQLR